MSFLTYCLLAAFIFGRDTPEPIKQFNKRIHEYLDIQKKADSSLPPEAKAGKKEPDPAVIVKHQLELAKAIRAARAYAVRGDIFIPSVRPVFKALIGQELKGPDGATARSMILGEGNPKNPESRAKVDLKVNAAYPAKAPLSTVPPSVLRVLPPLPDGLEYRFVGRHLILRDAKADLIVDILRNAIR